MQPKQNLLFFNMNWIQYFFMKTENPTLWCFLLFKGNTRNSLQHYAIQYFAHKHVLLCKSSAFVHIL